MDKKRLIGLSLSFFIPGAGQIYLDREIRGIIILITFFSVLFVTIFVFAWIGYLISTGFWIWQLYDVNKIGKRMEEKKLKPNF